MAERNEGAGGPPRFFKTGPPEIVRKPPSRNYPGEVLPLLELHLGRNGATMNVGMGGADVSLGTVAQSIAGLDAWRVNAELWTSKQDEAHKYTSGMRTLYSVGGAQELALYQELLSGKTNIEELASGDYKAKTEANGDGTKTIYLGQGALADGSRFGLNILLAHEAYRNGIDDGVEGQRVETQQAVLGHIGAALALSQVYRLGSIGTEMAEEVNTYLEALKSNNYEALGKLLAGYDSSGDYWRLTKDGKLVFDKRASLTIENPDGTTKEISWKELGVSSDRAVESALTKILKVDSATARTIMEKQMGLVHSADKDPEKWNWLSENKKLPEKGWYPFVPSIGEINEGKGMYVRDLSKNIQAVMLRDVFTATYRNELQGGIENPKLINGLISSEAKWSNPGSATYDPFSIRVLQEFGSVFNSLEKQQQRDVVSHSNTPMIAETFFNEIMSPAEWEKYKAKGNTTYCSTFGYEKLVSLDPRIAVSAFPNGFLRANSWQAALASSPLFTEIQGTDALNTMVSAANRASEKQLVIGVLNKNPESGHVAFVVPSATPYKSFNGVVPITGNGLLGYNGNTGNDPGFTIPVFAGVGAPKATGILPFGYTFGSIERDIPLNYKRITYYRLGW
ncbi:hypothetical protein [Gracilinema caldarium]|uniref:Uncharacterized protein n=1 Tax=Gracilinema caldarium (strain ATCC 51460 / DSM 7334 / H1) TaxID=744872 RepID=F8EYY9_GRAC1|nr:hypothetical protein [Gracilinema caldarium]AEJ19220.1 hypothetical protein Spica_1072 [Gracilinema caldarium DSM 7334]